MINRKYLLVTQTPGRSKILSALLSASIALSIFTYPTLASVDVSTGAAPAQPAAAGTYTVSTADSASYVEPVNTYSDGAPTYYLVTQDPLKASWSSVTYDGVDYPLTPTNIKVLPAVSGKADIPVSLKGIFAANATIFFDDGTYNDIEPNAYNRFTNTNFSMVGLYKDANGEPTAKITKSARTDGMIERNIVMHKDVYYENLIFDGNGRNLVSGSRGENAFAISGAAAPWNGSEGFVMKDCIIQNYGASNSHNFWVSANKNSAIMFYMSTGQHNLENIIIRSMKTQDYSGVIHFNQSTQNYFKDISIDGSLTNANATAIKIESRPPNTFAANLIDNTFSGSLTLTPSPNFSRVYIQGYAYSTVLPDTMKYVQYSTTNGNDSKQAAYVSSDLPSTAANTAVWNRSDNYWVVRSGAAQTVSAQLDYIKSVLTNTAAAGGVVPTANIKLSAGVTGLLDAFTVPDFGDIDVNIVAVAAASDPYSSTAMIPLAADAVITLPETNYGKVRLYNVDFHQNAKYTLQEAVAGINPASVSLTDPNETGLISGYPVYSSYAPAALAAKVIRSTSDTFVNCRFTSLAGEIEVTNIISKIGVGSDAAFAARLTDSDTNSYTGSAITSGLKDTADDATVNWFSSDPSIVSIDKLTGVATALTTGTVTITAKAADSHNNGEIEKPFVTFSLQAALPYTVTYSGNGNTGGSLSSAVNNYLDGDTSLVFGIETLVRDGFRFVGWNTMEDGSGNLYQPGDVLVVSDNIAFFAQWELIPPTSTPTPSVTPDPTASPTPSVTPDPTVSPTPSVTPDPTVSPTPSVTPDPTVSPTPSVTPEPTVSPTQTPTQVPTPAPTEAPSPTEAPAPTETPAPTLTSSPTASPTPPTGVLGTDRPVTPVPTATFTPTAVPSDKVLSAFTKTGEQADSLLVLGALAIVLSGGVVAWIVIRNRKKHK